MIQDVIFRVQEIINDDHRESGRIPRTVDCELTDDLGKDTGLKKN